MTRDTRIVALALLAISGAMLVATLVSTLAIAEGASPQWRLLFRIFCHGIPERSLMLLGEAMPICARCFGIYAGLLAGVAVSAARPSIGERPARVAAYLAALPIGIDGVSQALGLRLSTNPLRVATGLTVAIAFAIWALAFVQHRRETAITNS